MTIQPPETDPINDFNEAYTALRDALTLSFQGDRRFTKLEAILNTRPELLTAQLRKVTPLVAATESFLLQYSGEWQRTDPIVATHNFRRIFNIVKTTLENKGLEKPAIAQFMYDFICVPSKMLSERRNYGLPKHGMTWRMLVTELSAPLSESTSLDDLIKEYVDTTEMTKLIDFCDELHSRKKWKKSDKRGGLGK